MRPFVLGGHPNLKDLAAIARGRRVVLPPRARARMASARRVLVRAAEKGTPVYGVNTGFGELAGARIPADRLMELQRNLVLSHACAVGEALSDQEARCLVFLRANELARGHSGCRPEIALFLARLLNAGVIPVVPCRGSVGASGDLAPQAHMALVVIGEGEARYKGRKMPGREALKRAGIKPLVLEMKEGLSLLNGTQTMQAVGGLDLEAAFRVYEAAQLAGAMSLEGMTGTPDPFDPAIHRLKPHEGQRRAADSLRSLLSKSKLRESHRFSDSRVQDAYSFRCMPQVHGTVLDGLEYAGRVVETEMGSVTDNPVVVDGKVLSGGNFHGAALSQGFDLAAIAMTTLGNISERRIAQLVSGDSPGLKPFLADDPGAESGWMIAQVTAAALASENKTYAHPASADSISTSAGKEDHVSMGMGAALKLKRVVWNTAQIVAVELLCAARAVEVHAPLKPGKGVALGLGKLRRKVARAWGDQIIGPSLEAVRRLILEGYFKPW